MSKQSEQQAILESARELVAKLEQGSTDGVQEHLDHITRLRETQLYQELGQLTRELHEALKAFKVDTRLNELAGEIPDAQDRLTHVINMTEQSAHRTLTAIEESLPVVDGISTRGQALLDRWQQFRARKLSAAEFRDLSKDLEAFLGSVQSESGAVQSHLTDALMAQDYQDLTGQIIRRVINLVQEVESGLVSLISLSAAQRGDETAIAADKPDTAKPAKKKKSAPSELEGPQVPGNESESAVKGQDEVDDLLSSLGF
ncbi:MAG: protein phosphatase CheZ [Ectothiorhodospiraceae bacterium]|nr:protein phosphatase CheZ [Ectothiorhodospiraceae bacterium]